VFAGPHRGPFARAIVPRRQRHNHLLKEGFHIAELGGVAVIADNQFENIRAVYTSWTERIARKAICGASQPLLARRKRVTLMFWMSEDAVSCA
jgi:hypothetical protein